MMPVLLATALLARVRPINKSPVFCAATSATLCKWSSELGACYPDSNCRPTRCGVLQCSCQAAPLHELTPWEVLGLNPRDAFSPYDVKSAFLEVAQTLHPDKNSECRELAGETFIAARHARDTLLKMTTTFGEPEAQTIASAMIKEQTPSSTAVGRPEPLIPSLLRLGRRALRDTARSVNTKLRKLKEMFTDSLSYYLRHPAVFILGSIALQFLALSQF